MLDNISSSKSSSRRYTLNENIFEIIDTEEKAYWLGFLLADGSICVRKNTGQSTIKISLASIDKNHIQKFLDFVGCDMPIRTYMVGNGANDNLSESCEVTITSKKIVSDLAKLGIGPKKSFTVEIPKVAEHLVKHLVRGIWDGDGSVLFRAKRKKYPDNFNPEVQICGNEKVVGKINDIFVEKLGLKRATLTPTAKIFLFRKTSLPAKIVVEYLYKDCTIALDRKLEKAKLCMNWQSRKEGCKYQF